MEQQKKIETNEDSAEFFFQRAEKLKVHGVVPYDQIELALGLYDKAIQKNENFAEAHYEKASCLSDLNRHHDAISSYNNAIECCGETFEEIKLYPEAEKFYVYRSISLACMKQPRDAIDALDSAIVINPDYADAYYQYGLNLMDLNRYDEAIPKFENAIRLDPENLEIYRHKIHALEELKRYEEAEQLKIDLQFLQNYPLDRDASNSPYYESSDYSSNQDSDSSDSSYQPSILGKDSTEYE
jgi:tetratricopeptide (TPR) repeat protein